MKRRRSENTAYSRKPSTVISAAAANPTDSTPNRPCRSGRVCSSLICESTTSTHSTITPIASTPRTMSAGAAPGSIFNQMRYGNCIPTCSEI